MNKFASVVSLALASAGIASGCAVDSVDSGNPEAVETYEGAVCAQNPSDNALAAMFANLAATMAIEFKRMQFTQDLEIYRGAYNQEMLRIKSSSLGLCGASACKGTKAILAFQNPQSKPFIFANGAQLDPWAFSSRLVPGYRGQKNCEDRARNGDSSACVAEPHYFELSATTPLSPVCGIGGLNLLSFKTSKADANGNKLNPEQRLNDASKLQRLFLWTDTDQTLPVNMNDFMQFSVSSDGLYTNFDPGEGSYPPPGTSGSCGTSLLKFSYTSITGTCCSYNGGTNMSYQPYIIQPDGSGYWKCQNN
jgi:hypothetical protein